MFASKDIMVNNIYIKKKKTTISVYNEHNYVSFSLSLLFYAQEYILWENSAFMNERLFVYIVPYELTYNSVIKIYITQ